MGEGSNTAKENPYKQSYKTLAGLCLVVSVLPLAANGTDQTTAQQEARRLNDQGSDDSLEASYGNALHAVDNFFALNIPGAIKHGVKAYGQYRNSEKLENLRDKNKALAGSMSSVGAGRPEASGITGTGQYVSPYHHLDRKFLREGPNAEIAARIERLSGISREKMFQMAVETHTNSKSLADPDFVPWGMRTFRELTGKAPNEDFRAALNKFGDKVEALIFTGAVRGVLAQFRGVESGEVAATMVAGAGPRIEAGKIENGAEMSMAPAEAIPPAEPSHEEARSEDPNSVFTARGVVGEVSRHQRPGFDRLQLDEQDPFFAEIARNTDEAPEAEASIFKVVSRKIQEMSYRQSLVRLNVAGR